VGAWRHFTQMIGRHGEGLKLAALVLLRNSKPMRLETGSVSVAFELSADDVSEQRALHFRLLDLNVPTTETSVVVENKSIDEFEKVRATILLSSIRPATSQLEMADPWLLRRIR